jgi:hypothetical protein
MKNTKLSLADFKAKADSTNEKELLNNIQGGRWKDCHGFSGGLGKFWRGEADSITWEVGG